ncbi:unnamed protein product [Cyprideis torosa]|uniref:Uncharacterized protein n=1 Tax=Cyprideis torosa TaxID=163714 RepID=A0A7R8WCG3_9CRUS|nr:unnamed protein product [Cyprideis torosa]CAG0890761.1 unnamed protein product [Cyprideis torosa]
MRLLLLVSMSVMAASGDQPTYEGNQRDLAPRSFFGEITQDEARDHLQASIFEGPSIIAILVFAYLVRSLLNVVAVNGRGFGGSLLKFPKFSFSWELPDEFKADFQQQFFSFLRSAPLLLESRESDSETWWDVPVSLLTAGRLNEFDITIAAWGLSRTDDSACIRQYACQHKLNRGNSLVGTLTHWAITGIGSYYGHQLEPYSGDMIQSRMDVYNCESAEPMCKKEVISQAETPGKLITNIGGWAYRFFYNNADSNQRIDKESEEEGNEYESPMDEPEVRESYPVRSYFRRRPLQGN